MTRLDHVVILIKDLILILLSSISLLWRPRMHLDMLVVVTGVCTWPRQTRNIGALHWSVVTLVLALMKSLMILELLIAGKLLSTV